jgi:hypothetical protein
MEIVTLGMALDSILRVNFTAAVREASLLALRGRLNSSFENSMTHLVRLALQTKLNEGEVASSSISIDVGSSESTVTASSSSRTTQSTSASSDLGSTASASTVDDDSSGRQTVNTYHSSFSSLYEQVTCNIISCFVLFCEFPKIDKPYFIELVSILPSCHKKQENELTRTFSLAE